MAILHKNISAEGDIHNPKWFSGANNGDVAWRNELGVLESTDELVLPAALDFVDGSVAPPTSNSGDIYVLSSGGSVNAGWGTVSLGDWVRYDGTTWNVITPQKSSLCYNETTDALNSYDGSTWSAIGGGGGGIDNVTSAEKAALSPSVGDFVYDTDLSSIQRYDGSNWVSVANGYGAISVNDSSGIPTYYADLQTAINATASKDTVYIHSDIELTSSVTIPPRSSLTIALNGHRIWGDTTSGDFYLFGMQNNNTERHLHINGGGVIETIGAATSATDASPFKFASVGSGVLSCYFNDTKIKSENAYAFYTNGFSLLDGGHFYSTNTNMYCKVTKLINAYVDTATRPTLGISTIDCKLTSRGYGFFMNRLDSWIGNHISGTVTQSGNYGLLYCYSSSTVVNNYLEQTDSAGRDALYVKESDTRVGKMTNNICINRGTGAGGNLQYGSCSDNYFYSALGIALTVGGSVKRVVNNICITESTNSNALRSLADYTVGNTAICTDVSHTVAPIVVGGVINEVFANKAICYNPLTLNIQLQSVGTIYLANNIMSSVGSGLDLNGNTNAMTNTPDSFGNIKIG